MKTGADVLTALGLQDYIVLHEWDILNAEGVIVKTVTTSRKDRAIAAGKIPRSIKAFVKLKYKGIRGGRSEN